MSSAGTSPLRLAVLDICNPENLVATAQLAEALGMSRYWFTEHHSDGQSASPTLATATVAPIVKHIRLGTAGILLQYQSPLRVIEDFALLELLFGNRFDLGVAGAQAPPWAHQHLLDGRSQPTLDSYSSRVTELVGWARDRPAGILGTGALQAELWMCGMNRNSAELAGRLGMSYAFHHFLHRGRPAAADGPEIVDRYREAAAAVGRRPYVSLACFGICADTASEAQALWREQAGPGHAALAAPCFAGGPSECREQLEQIADEYGANEIAVHCPTNRQKTKFNSLTRLADALNLRGMPLT
jgi:luciferase family oxidoreductase group 1